MGRTGFYWLGYGLVAGFCEYGNEPSGSIKDTGYCLTIRVTISFSKNVLHHGVSKLLFVLLRWINHVLCNCVLFHLLIHFQYQQHLLANYLFYGVDTAQSV